MGVEDEEYGQRVGVIITLAQKVRQSLSIEDLRTDMRKALPAYKLPTLLRVVEGELPKGPTGKVQKKILGPQLFPTSGWQNDQNIQIWDRRSSPTKAKL